jgi:hypothetical protein
MPPPVSFAHWQKTKGCSAPLKIPYLFYENIIGVLVIVAVHGVYTDTIISVCGFLILVSCVKSIAIYIVSLEIHNYARRSPS